MVNGEDPVPSRNYYPTFQILTVNKKQTFLQDKVDIFF